ncbi:hypothetical protein B0H12DRAFT_1162774 [Mycena haematopus]|nr:hypothetical protein B0H12DRAFT_1162774 [Mycena haematopus]
MLGKLVLDGRGPVVSTFRPSPRSSSPDEEQSSLGGGSSVYEDDEDACFTDDAHIHRQSRLISPIEFATTRPSSSQLAPQPSRTSPPDDDDESAGPVTPIADLPPLRPPPNDLLAHHTRHESYASIHNHYSDQTSPESECIQFRPDTPFLDTLVAVNSQVVVSPRHVHRSPSAIRNEAKQGWMGEWNQDDMQDVIQKLRSLK